MSNQTQPHPQVPIGSLEPGTRVRSVYHLVSLEQRAKKNGDPYFMMQFGDASGCCNGIMWDNHDNLLAGIVQADDFVTVEGDAGEFNNNLQITVRKITRIEDTEINLRDFLPASPRDRAEMEAELDAWIAKVQHPDCQRLLERIFGHDKLRELYCNAPAAQRVHQAYIHGLLDHTLAVMNLAWKIADQYEPVNRDILITGALLHDIGKVRELTWHRTITYTTEGRLLGHISMGASMIDGLIQELRRKDGFDQDVHTQILHLILSHHGKLEFGSPVLPKTREALILHYADNTEAYMASFAAEIARHAEKGQSWTPFNKMFQSYLFTGGPAAAPMPQGQELPHQRTDDRPDPLEDVAP